MTGRKRTTPAQPPPKGRTARPNSPRAGRPERDGLIVVGVGASAGGLEAFTHLLEALPNDTGMAFVLVQHLAPKHDSALVSLLAPATGMKVEEVREGTPLLPNHVYVIPPNSQMEVTRGRLHLMPRPSGPSQHNPIDYFFRSMARAV